MSFGGTVENVDASHFHLQDFTHSMESWEKPTQRDLHHNAQHRNGSLCHLDDNSVWVVKDEKQSLGEDWHKSFTFEDLARIAAGLRQSDNGLETKSYIFDDILFHNTFTGFSCAEWLSTNLSKPWGFSGFRSAIAIAQVLLDVGFLRKLTIDDIQIFYASTDSYACLQVPIVDILNDPQPTFYDVKSEEKQKTRARPFSTPSGPKSDRSTRKSGSAPTTSQHRHLRQLEGNPTSQPTRTRSKSHRSRSSSHPGTGPTGRATSTTTPISSTSNTTSKNTHRREREGRTPLKASLSFLSKFIPSLKNQIKDSNTEPNTEPNTESYTEHNTEQSQSTNTNTSQTSNSTHKFLPSSLEIVEALYNCRQNVTAAVDNGHMVFWGSPPVKRPAELVCVDALSQLKTLYVTSNQTGDPTTIPEQFPMKWHQFCRTVEELRTVDLIPHEMGHRTLLSFWINVYNCIYMHAFVTLGTPRDECERLQFCRNACYRIAGHQFSLLDIKYSILRDLQMVPEGLLDEKVLMFPPCFQPQDPRRKYIVKSDPRVIFALCNGTFSSPNLFIFCGELLDQLLNYAVEQYVVSFTAFDFSTDRPFGSVLQSGKSVLRVRFPQLMTWHRDDFGKTSVYMVAWLGEFLPDDLIRSKIADFVSSGAVEEEVLPYDWTFSTSCYDDYNAEANLDQSMVDFV